MKCGISHLEKENLRTSSFRSSFLFLTSLSSLSFSLFRAVSRSLERASAGSTFEGAVKLRGTEGNGDLLLLAE